MDLAAGLIDKPQLLVLDEPTTGLDPRSRQVVWSTVRELVAEGVTLLLTTQYLEEADALADRVVLIDHGREIAAGTPAQLKAQVGEQRVDVLAADGAALERLREALEGRFEIAVARGAAHDLDPGAGRGRGPRARDAGDQSDSGIAVDEIALRRPTLDDAFLALTGHPAEDGGGERSEAEQAPPNTRADRAESPEREVVTR